jgi:Zn-dependent peptidase ImmA (M78 family)
MKLSYNDIEKIAEAELTAFLGGLVKSEKEIKSIPIIKFANHHLGLRLVHTRLSDDGQTLGLTTYTDTDIKLRRYGKFETIHIHKNTILLDESLKDTQLWQNDELGRCRFTIAHECAHHIIYRMIPEEEREKINKQYAARTISSKEMKTLEDWSEWQANALGSALLMPKKYIKLMLNNRRLKFYGKRLNRPDQHIFFTMCRKLSVSETMLRYRLEKLGYLQFLSSIDYSDPSDIICEDDFHRLLSTEESNYA